MKRVLNHLEQKQQAFISLPFFTFLEDHGIGPRQRLSFMPCLAPFVMGFPELRRYLLGNDSAAATLQQLLEVPIREDAHGWSLYLKDLQTLGINFPKDFAGMVRFLWGNDYRQSHEVIRGLIQLSMGANPMMRRLLLRTLVAVGAATLRPFSHVAREFQGRTDSVLGSFIALQEWLWLEAGYVLGNEMDLSPEMEQEALKMIDQVFELFTDLSNELLTYVYDSLQRERQQARAQLEWGAASAI